MDAQQSGPTAEVPAGPEPVAMELALDDAEDPFQPDPAEASAAKGWLAAYRRASAPHLPRELRVFAWKLLHGGLPCGGVRAHSAASREQCACPLPACRAGAGQLRVASLAHVLLECPAAAEAWAWFAQLWQRLQPQGQQPPITARVILMDDDSVWRPPQRLRRLWTRLRLGMLQALWQRRGQGAELEVRAAADAAVHHFRAKLRRQIRMDWRRCEGDVRLASGVPLSWLAGRQPVLSPEEFRARWCAGGVLAGLTPAGNGWRMTMRC